MTFQALESQSTAELLAEQIRDAILVGKLHPGDRLIEQELSESFKTSRGPIREAIRILATEGLVEHRKNRGAIVAAPNRQGDSPKPASAQVPIDQIFKPVTKSPRSG